jgi:hypothetical protein
MEAFGNTTIDINHMVRKTATHPLSVSVSIECSIVFLPVLLADSFLHNPPNLPYRGIALNEDVNISETFASQEVKTEVGKGVIHGSSVSADSVIVLGGYRFHSVLFFVHKFMSRSALYQGVSWAKVPS